MASRSPLQPFLQKQPAIILDGGLATALEAQGHNLNDPLWSAKLLIEAPDAIKKMHEIYLAAGADCITSATYQASLPGFRSRGLDENEARRLMGEATGLAVAARDEFWQQQGPATHRIRPIVAASVGPYGAFLADGSEYTGRYGATVTELYDFHRPRWELLQQESAELLACETIPSLPEVEVLLRLLEQSPDVWAWLSFSCRDGEHLCDGSAIRDAVTACDGIPNVAAVGINCTSPLHISSLLAIAKEHTTKPIIVYPNLGERFDPVSKTWGAEPPVKDWLTSAARWVTEGARGVGGCCRIGPETISKLRARLLDR